MNFNDLLSAAAGYFGDQKKQDAQIELAKLGVAQSTATAQTATANATASTNSAQWIPGIPNGAVIAGGAALALVAVVALSRR